jgi:predicted dehydrogenase
METIRIGILGAGFISRVHTESFKKVPGVEIVAICDQDADRGKAMCEVYNIPRYYSDHKELLKDKDVSVVTIALPNYLHAQMAIAAAQAGKHVICEKPLALTIEDAEAMIEACKKAGVVLAYAEELCFAPKVCQDKGDR